jgi:2',3'-cyclic-nucleotide 2'-phosphodiesterase (5'-nucleotidase family)
VIVWLLWWFILAPWGYANQVDLKIFYLNDFHGFAKSYQPTGSASPLGGIAYLAGAVDAARGKQPSLLLSAGDMIQGNSWANLFQGKSTIEVMNAMKFDAMVVGDQEFDFGLKVLKKRMAQALIDASNLKSGMAGLTDGSKAGDWRLPNVRELHSLIDFGRGTPALPEG